MLYWIGLLGGKCDVGLGIDFAVVDEGYVFIMLLYVDLIVYSV